MRLGKLTAIALAYGAAFGVAIIGVAAAVYIVTQRALDQEVDRRLATESMEVIGDERPVSLAAVANRIREREGRRSTSDLGYALIDRSHHRVAGKLSINAPPLGFSKVDIADDGFEGIAGNRALATPIPGGMTLVLVADSEPIDHLDVLLLRIFVIGFGTTILIGFAAGAALSASIGRMVAAITRTAGAIIDGDLQQRMPVDGTGDAFDRQALTLNRMLDRIEELMVSLKHVSNDIAHDLRTPLSRLRNRLASMASIADVDCLRKEASLALSQSDGILALFAAVLRLAEIEAGSRRSHFKQVALGQLARKLIALFGPSIEDGGRLLTLDEAAEIMVRGDEELIAQMLVNVIQNAVKHTPPGTTIKLRVERNHERAVLTVTDDGPGIAPGDRARAMSRFGRLEASRTDAGHGLGLALVEAIARLHEGTVALGDAAPGVIVRIDLPLPRPSSYLKAREPT